MPRMLHIAVMAALLTVGGAQAQMPITTDSRIKTLVFNENEVYTVTTHYGYQANVEFGKNESIETVSVGDRVAWQIVPAGRRLFIRAMEENAHTNMTIVTNKRAYQFDLRSSDSNAVYGSAELTYVVRFFYPEESAPAVAMPPTMPMQPTFSAVPTAPVVAQGLPPSHLPSPNQLLPVPQGNPFSVATTPVVPPPEPIAQAPLSPLQPIGTPGANVPLPNASASNINYRYTFSGPTDVAPVKIYDDGKSTYFKFRSPPQGARFAVITNQGEEIDVPFTLNAEGLAVINIVAPRVSLQKNNARVIVYNEAMS